MSRLFELTGTIQNYAWGGMTFIADLLDIRADEKPIAEYWLGTHPKSPSKIVFEEHESDSQENLGTTFEDFSALPFLFKVLDVKNMLSIQVHPNKRQAEIGFKRENELNIPIEAPHRNYKDDNHKPEIMVALSEFWLLHGFLSEEDLSQRLEAIPEFSDLIPTFKSEGYKGLYQKVMVQTQEECNEHLRPLMDRIRPLYINDQLDKLNPDFWAARAMDLDASSTDLDRGIYSIYFFNIVKAKPGQAIFQDAGLPHAYLEGQNIELMASSDNVLRGGLTPKHVDIEELMGNVRFEETNPILLRGERLEDGMESVYRAPVRDFQISKIDISGGQGYERTSSSIEILLATQGDATISEGAKEINLSKGKSVILLAGANYKIATETGATLFKAGTP